MENSVTFKPVLWRLIIRSFFPFYIGFMIAESILKAITHYSSALSAIETALACLIGTIIAALLFHNKFDISIYEGNISGLSTGWGLFRETFPIADVDLSYRDQRSFYEKINFVRTIRSLSGHKILVVDFIYGRPATDEIYRIAEHEQMQQ